MLASLSSSSLARLAAWATMQQPPQPGHGQLLVVGIDENEEGESWDRRRALPRHLHGSEARVAGRAFRASRDRVGGKIPLLAGMQG